MDVSVFENWKAQYRDTVGVIVLVITYCTMPCIESQPSTDRILGYYCSGAVSYLDPISRLQGQPGASLPLPESSIWGWVPWLTPDPEGRSGHYLYLLTAC